MSDPAPPVTDVRDISRIAYGFLASKALFAALHLDLFTRLRGGPKDAVVLAAETGSAPHRLETLLSALASVGLVVRAGDRYANAPASERYLVRGAPGDFGDYYRYQVDRLIYPALEHLDAGLAGDTAGLAPGFDAWDTTEAADFSRAQHAGSLGPALLLARTVDLAGRRTLLDIAGGSGAFSITLCQRHPALTATVIDFPRMVEVARRFVHDAGLDTRIALVPGNALETPWPDRTDVVLMSYLLSAVAGRDIDVLLDRARDALGPGGLLLVHDFMLEGDRTGPPLAAWWFLVYLAWGVDNVSFTAVEIAAALERRGFVDIAIQPLVHGITQLVSAVKR